MLDSLAASARRAPDPDLLAAAPHPATQQGHACVQCGRPWLGLASVCPPCSRAAQYPEQGPRPQRRRPRALPRFCSNCRAVVLPGQGAGGRCHRCALYWGRRGFERPPVPESLVPRPVYPCGTCGRPTRPNDGRARGLCHRCAQRAARGLAGRPPRVPAPEAPCANCGGPAPVGHRRKGECLLCAVYRRNRGRPRPPHLWGRARRAPGGADV